MLELKTSYHDGILNIEMYGALDSLTAPDFKFWLTQKSSNGYHYFALNCGGLEFISSRGIGIITELNNILNAKDRRLILYHVSNEVLNLLNFLKLSENIPIVDTFAHVKEKFGEKPAQKTIHEPKEQARPETGTKPPEMASEPTMPEIQDLSEKNYIGISTSTELQPESEKVPAPERQPETKPSTSTSTTTIEKTETGARTTTEEIKTSLKTTEEEYIDLSEIETSKSGYDIAKMNIVFCPNCGQNLRVSKKGLYLCPECRTKFNYPFLS